MTDQPLSNRHIVVSGGTGALGRAVVERLLRAGAVCHVPARDIAVATDSGTERLQLVAGVDLTDETAVGDFYAAIPDLWASVHLAGGFAMGPLAQIGRAEFLRMIEMNTVTAFLCSRAAAAAIRKSGRGGRIVNVAARAAMEPRKGAGMVAYGVSKAGVSALTQALAEELKGDDILVNAIAPSTIDTPANRAAMPNADPTRWLDPNAAAEAVLHLVSPAATEISGAILPLYARA